MQDNVTTVAEWAEGAFDYMAMGSRHGSGSSIFPLYVVLRREGSY